LGFFNKWRAVAMNEDVRALNLIARMIDYNPINRPSLDQVLAVPFIQAHLQPLTPAQRTIYDSVINF
jgi:serine/threonine protein kinase